MAMAIRHISLVLREKHIDLVQCTSHSIYIRTVKPSNSSHSKPLLRCLRCFVLEHIVFKTKHLRRLVRGFECLEILGLRPSILFSSRTFDSFPTGLGRNHFDT